LLDDLVENLENSMPSVVLDDVEKQLVARKHFRVIRIVDEVLDVREQLAPRMIVVVDSPECDPLMESSDVGVSWFK
jgi:hypothetical protein